MVFAARNPEEDTKKCLTSASAKLLVQLAANCVAFIANAIEQRDVTFESTKTSGKVVLFCEIFRGTIDAVHGCNSNHQLPISASLTLLEYRWIKVTQKGDYRVPGRQPLDDKGVDDARA